MREEKKKTEELEVKYSGVPGHLEKTGLLSKATDVTSLPITDEEPFKRMHYTSIPKEIIFKVHGLKHSAAISEISWGARLSC